MTLTVQQPELCLTTEQAFSTIPASTYNYTELADIYNQTRVDYIVPMPMNAKRMEVYVKSYDIDLDASVVAFDADGEMAGVGMLGRRGDRAWITRLGVLPYRRGHQLGRFLMETLIAQAVRGGARLIQLEVIKGNTPAYRLFLKLGFKETRELLVIRRPPGKPLMENPLPQAAVTPLTPDEVQGCLTQQHTTGASWLDETASLLQAGSLKGLRVVLPSGAAGWVVYQQTALQIGYIVLHTPWPARDELTRALLYHLHSLHPLQDTKVENIPALDLRWPVYQEFGYVEAFRRIEMFLYL
ncbi:MAG: GNAT family N-acetyltransferase [Chloroflexi bacterium]|nr:GNAT family N-acetyltransferase [Chloroflexota bacterium]